MTIPAVVLSVLLLSAVMAPVASARTTNAAVAAPAALVTQFDPGQTAADAFETFNEFCAAAIFAFQALSSGIGVGLNTLATNLTSDPDAGTAGQAAADAGTMATVQGATAAVAAIAVAGQSAATTVFDGEELLMPA